MYCPSQNTFLSKNSKKKKPGYPSIPCQSLLFWPLFFFLTKSKLLSQVLSFFLILGEKNFDSIPFDTESFFFFLFPLSSFPSLIDCLASLLFSFLSYIFVFVWVNFKGRKEGKVWRLQLHFILIFWSMIEMWFFFLSRKGFPVFLQNFVPFCVLWNNLKHNGWPSGCSI